jgi:hypothetical protein
MIVNSLDLSHSVSGKVTLEDTGDNAISYIQWPVHSSDGTISRIYDGSPYLEIDLSPTKGYENSISTHPVKINEINYSTDEFIELYNTDTDTYTLSGYSLRNKNNTDFVFTRKVPPVSFTAVDFSSVDDLSSTYIDCFGSSGLDSDSDFIVLENPAGQVVDRVTWQGTQKFYYDEDGVLDLYLNDAFSGAANSISRTTTDGNDTDDDSVDFSATAKTPGVRNNSTVQPGNNSLSYPYDSIDLPRNFKINFSLGEDSSGGYTDTLWFIRTGGTADLNSPHIFRLDNLGVELSVADVQVSTITGVSQQDIDGNSLVNGAIYRMIFNSDTGSGAASQITVNDLTYDTSIHDVAVSSITPSFKTLNEGIKAGIMRLDITNNSPVAGNDIELQNISVYIDDGTDPLTTVEAQNMFDELYVVYNSTDFASDTEFQINKDIYVGSISSSSFNLVSGNQYIDVSIPDLSETVIAPQETKTFFVSVLLSSAAAVYSPNTFSMTVDADVDVKVRESVSDVIQNITNISSVNSQTMSIIEGSNIDWENVTTSSAPVYSMPYTSSYDDDVYTGSDDGEIVAIDENGNKKWGFNASGKIRSNIYGVEADSSTPAYLFFADENGNVYKLRDNGSSCTQMWSKPLAQNAGQVVVRDYVYATGNNGNMYKLSSETGSDAVGWDGSLAGSLQGTPVIMDGWKGIYALWVTSDNGRVYRLQLSDGTATSSLLTGGTIETSPTLEAGYLNPELETNLLYTASTDGKIYCRTSANLANIPAGWTNRSGQNDGEYDTGSPIRGGIHRSILAESGKKYLYFGNDAGELYRLTTSSGTMSWAQPFQAEGMIKTTPVMLMGAWLGVGGDYVYFGDSKGYFYAVSAADGSTIRSGYPIYLGSAVLSDPTVKITKKRIYIGTEDGRIHAINIGP